MSYSFTVSAASKAAVKKLVADEYDKIVGYQICHAQDRRQAEGAVSAFIDILQDDANKDVHVAVHGSLSGDWTPANDISRVTASNISITAAYHTRSKV